MGVAAHGSRRRETHHPGVAFLHAPSCTLHVLHEMHFTKAPDWGIDSRIPRGAQGLWPSHSGVRILDLEYPPPAVPLRTSAPPHDEICPARRRAPVTGVRIA